MSDAPKCEPPEELRGVDGWWWVSLDGGEPEVARWVTGGAASSVSGWWLNGNRKPHSADWIERDEGAVTCLEPPLTPAEAATLRAERDAAVADAARLRDVEKWARDFTHWATQGVFTDPENMLVCAEWHGLRAALRAALAAVIPLVQQAEREKCAEVAEAAYRLLHPKPSNRIVAENTGHAVARAIRARNTPCAS